MEGRHTLGSGKVWTTGAGSSYPGGGVPGRRSRRSVAIATGFPAARRRGAWARRAPEPALPDHFIVVRGAWSPPEARRDREDPRGSR